MISTKKLVMALAGGFCILFSGCTTIRELPPEETVQIRSMSCAGICWAHF